MTRQDCWATRISVRGFSIASENLLTDLGIAQFGVPGFTPPFGAGAYSFWLQQESSVAEGYQLDFKVDAVPEPASAALFLIGGLGAAFRRAKRLS